MRISDLAVALERAIVQRIGEPRFNLWFVNHTQFQWEDDRLTVGVPNLFQQNYLESKFGDDLKAAWSAMKRLAKAHPAPGTYPQRPPAGRALRARHP